MGSQQHQRIRTAWVILPITAILLFLAVYYFAVLTVDGQLFENAALDGQRLQNISYLNDADETLANISRISLGLSIIAVFVIGLVRNRPRLAVAGAGTIVVSVGIAEVLKRFILPRPDLVGAPADLLQNSFPSGHTTIAMSLLVATLIVIPYRGRGWAMFFVFSWAVGIGSATIAAHWHRLSDTLGADLIAVGVGALFSIWLAKSGDVRRADTKTYVGRSLLIIFWIGVAVTFIGAAVIFIANMNRLSGNDYQEVAYNLTHVAAGAGSIISGLVFWFSWHHLEVPAKVRS